MRCAIVQPTYLPWMGYFDLIDQVECFVFLDHVQMVKRSWDTRNRIRTSNGIVWLTVPVLSTTHRDARTFTNAPTDDAQPWRRKHRRSIELAYKHAPCFESVFQEVASALESEVRCLADLNIAIIQRLCVGLSIRSRFLRSSTLEGVAGTRDPLLVSICRAVGADAYLSPIGAATYIERRNPAGAFRGSGIDLSYAQYEHPVYAQHHPGFVSHLSVVDLLMNHGWEKGRQLLLSGRRSPVSSSELI